MGGGVPEGGWEDEGKTGGVWGDGLGRAGLGMSGVEEGERERTRVVPSRRLGSVRRRSSLVEPITAPWMSRGGDGRERRVAGVRGVGLVGGARGRGEGAGVCQTREVALAARRCHSMRETRAAHARRLAQ